MPVAELVALTARIEKSTKKILLIPDLQGMPIMNTELRYLFSERLLMLRINNNLKSKIHITSKRVFDVVLSILLMPILLPALCIIGVFIKRESPGPVIFSHVRIGSGGKSVGVLKFRSMYVDAKERLEEILRADPEARAEWESSYKLKHDPRVTKIGRFLRETSLDELPQIFNVLIGEMSLVGPRPVIQDEIDKYYKEYAEYYFLTPPGITGLWQVSGRNDTSYDFRVKTDSWYASNWSLWLDLTILVKTAKVVLMREGAY
jgi:undecaprenyl-phosphate galactose phosphotransferase